MRGTGGGRHPDRHGPQHRFDRGSNVVGALTVTRTVTSVATGTRTFGPRSMRRMASTSRSGPHLRLAPGESASFEVTLTNTGARRVALRLVTWRSGNYEVRSPIAAKASCWRRRSRWQARARKDRSSSRSRSGSTAPTRRHPRAGAQRSAVGRRSQRPEPELRPERPDRHDRHPTDGHGLGVLRIAMRPRTSSHRTPTRTSTSICTRAARRSPVPERRHRRADRRHAARGRGLHAVRPRVVGAGGIPGAR